MKTLIKDLCKWGKENLVIDKKFWKILEEMAVENDKRTDKENESYNAVYH